ncbi:MAG: RagB/SusD family nutrient uptake outer membrane protein [Bacteroidia bacterium]|nr:RagB/SusD family nutrient uptake outer membrane protein [Bacteroidia bacterium]
MKATIKFSAIALLCFSFISCENFLKEELISDVSAGTYYTTVQGFEDAVKATYSEMKFFWGPERGFTMTAFGTDVHTNGADGSFKAINRYDGGLSSADAFIQDTWRDFYRGINQANAAINRSEGIEMDETLKANRLAEVRFLRALYYFTLVQFYGDIHLSLEETEGVQVEANRTPAADIYKAIIADLEVAVATLPATQNDYGRATKPAAEFLLAKVYATRGYQPYKEASDFANAEALMTSVISNYGFSLLDSFDKLWNQDNQRNSEVIFAVQNSKALADTRIDTEGNRGHLYFLMEYDIRPGMTRDTQNGRPWKRFRPTDFALSLWNRDIDSRYDMSYQHAWISNNAATIPKWTQAEADAGHVSASLVGQRKYALGDTAFFIPGPGKDQLWPADRKAKSRYIVYTKDNYDEKVFPTLKKFQDPRRPDRQHEPGSRDLVLMRLADAYLMRAEVRFMQNKLDEAAADINMVRERAAWPGKEAEMMITSGDVTIDYILDERARELDGEMHRWFDLARVKINGVSKLVERVRLHNPQAAPNIKDYHIFRPIPQNQIDRTLGGYKQNCGYPGADC